MAQPAGAKRQGPPTRPPSRPPSLEPPVPVVEPPPPPPPQNTWPCGCAYPGAHHTDCMWSLWEQMRDNYQQTKTLMGQFMTQVDGLQTSAKAKAECECPSSCHGKDLGRAMGLQQMQGVTVPWLQPPANTAPANITGPPGQVVDAGNYVSESRKLVEEQRHIQKTWAQFLNIFDMALDLANDVSKERCEAARRRKERERQDWRERREEERRERQERREKCTTERTKSKDEEGEADPQPEVKKKTEPKKSEAKSPPPTPPQKSTKPSVVEEKKEAPPPPKEEPEESPPPEATEDVQEAEPEVAQGAEEAEGAKAEEEAEAPAE